MESGTYSVKGKQLVLDVAEVTAAVPFSADTKIPLQAQRQAFDVGAGIALPEHETLDVRNGALLIRGPGRGFHWFSDLNYSTGQSAQLPDESLIKLTLSGH